MIMLLSLFPMTGIMSGLNRKGKQMRNPLEIEKNIEEYLEYYRTMIYVIENIEESERLVFAEEREQIIGSQLFKALVDFEREQAGLLRTDESRKDLAELHLRLSEKLFSDVSHNDTLVYRLLYIDGDEQPSLENLSQMLGITTCELEQRRDRAIEANTYIAGLLSFWNMPNSTE